MLLDMHEGIILARLGVSRPMLKIKLVARHAESNFMALAEFG